jgi:NADPH:quinone reductase-like Zn-dependent oxidoreductase
LHSFLTHLQIPDNLSFDEACTIPLGLATAACGLYQNKSDRGGDAGLVPPWEEGGAGKYTGQPILVIGGASSVGQFGEQVGRTFV